MRALDRAHISYSIHSYPVEDGNIDGVSVAQKVGYPPEQVFKTLVTRGSRGGCFVFVLPVNAELSLKKAALAVGEKAVSMLHVAELLPTTGYIRGGCSPVGMKKVFPTVLDQSSLTQQTILISAGKIGTQIEISPGDLLSLLDGKIADLLQI